ncbi:MAG: diaminopropionate ammonia-lyase [Dongiaceae bacterium]
MILDTAMPDWKPQRFATRLIPNALAALPDDPYPVALEPVLSADSFAAARAEIAGWPGYAPTMLHDLAGLAAAIGVGAVWYKDEGDRFGLGSFKALGGAYAVYRWLAERIAEKTGQRPTSADLLAGKHRDIAKGFTVATATDGNHGRSVAWGASLFGCRCIVYIHATVSEGRKAAIEQYGAEVRRIDGDYDDSVHLCAEEAAKNGWQVISDTSYDGYNEIPKLVMQGYGVMVDEALDTLARRGTGAPTHLFIQAGVGGLPAAVIARLWQRLEEARPYVVIVEPDVADCVYQTALAGKLAKASGNLDTLMAGLAAGEVSPLAWAVMKPGAHAFMTLPDTAAVHAMRALAAGVGGDRPVVGGEAGVGGLAGLLASTADPVLREALDLRADSRILIFGSEGDTDPVLYEKLVGRSGAAVRAAVQADNRASTEAGFRKSKSPGALLEDDSNDDARAER